MTPNPVTLTLRPTQALVLFGWLRRVEDSDGLFADQAEQRVVWDLVADLEKQLAEPHRADYPDILAAARTAERDQE